MMVETILESSQDFGMSNGSLPQWKRELLQRRAARARPPAAPTPPAPPPPPPATEDDEELRYGPGIVKRLKSRYLSLALREAPRRRPSVLRRAASLEHLLDERPPPAPRPHTRPARPASLAAPSYAALGAAPSPRRDSVKRARSVDALSRLDRDEPPQAPLQPPPQPPPPPPSPPPPLPRTTRPPRRPVPLLREAERPPADVVRSTLRKFESAPTRRAAPAARVSAVLRGLEALPRSSTPEPRGRSPSPAAADLSAIDEPEGTALPGCDSKAVSRAALDGIARAGSSVRYSFGAAARGSHLPPLAATNAVLLGRARRVGVIRPMPAAPTSPTPPTSADETDDKMEEVQPIPSPTPREEVLIKKEAPSAVEEPIVRPPEVISVPQTNGNATPSMSPREVTPEPETKPPQPEPPKSSVPKLVNGHSPPKSRIGAAGIERAWTGARAVGSGGGRPPPPASTSVVFNFSNRKEVPDYIENDGIILRANRRNRFKAGEAGIVVLRPEALAAESESEDEDTRPPSPLSVRFVNDNILINGKSSLAARPTKATKDRAAKLKLQFDDSLTRTFEYPSEISLCEDESPVQANINTNSNTNTTTNVNSTPTGTNGDAPLAQPALLAPLAANTHIVSASLGRYTPSKTCADSFQLGLTRRHDDALADKTGDDHSNHDSDLSTSVIEIPEGGEGDVRPCAAADAPSWSASRAHTAATDLLF